jgi:hypothetical protein
VRAVAAVLVVGALLAGCGSSPSTAIQWGGVTRSQWAACTTALSMAQHPRSSGGHGPPPDRVQTHRGGVAAVFARRGTALFRRFQSDLERAEVLTIRHERAAAVAAWSRAIAACGALHRPERRR